MTAIARVHVHASLYFWILIFLSSLPNIATIISSMRTRGTWKI